MQVLTDQQAEYVRYRIAGKTQAVAYKLAYKAARNWKETTIAPRACKLEALPHVRAVLDAARRQKLERAMEEGIVDGLDVIRELACIGFSDATDFVQYERVEREDGVSYGRVVITPTAQLTRKQRAAIAGIKEGANGVELKLHSKVQALRMLGDAAGLFIPAEDKTDQEDAEPYTGVPASAIAPTFAASYFDILRRKHLEYVFEGGRGSTKSSFVSIMLVDILMRNPNLHGIAVRRVADTLRTSVYAQLLWAIDILDLSDEWKATISPMEITRVATGQKIFFRGTDDPGKLKSVKVSFGHIGVLWLEELDQFDGPESVRKIEQSVIRGGDEAYIFKSFNPPKSANNWANLYLKTPKQNRFVMHSDYRGVPEEWLGRPFLDEAEHLREVNPVAYEHEYIGVANGVGGLVFENVTLREIEADEIVDFDRIYRGIDWGWYPDPFHFAEMHYDSARRKLYIYGEYRANKQSNTQTAKAIKAMGVRHDDTITADSAEPKSISDYRTEGLTCRKAEKGPDSVVYSMKWLASLAEIVIDPVRCPHSAQEFIAYEYDRDREGAVISGYPDKNNHGIDAVRYAMEQAWKRHVKPNNTLSGGL